jgi:hypothetical protein
MGCLMTSNCCAVNFAVFSGFMLIVAACHVRGCVATTRVWTLLLKVAESVFSIVIQYISTNVFSWLF